MDIPSILCMLVLVTGLFRPVGFLMSVSSFLAAFGALAVLPTELTGGVSLVAGTVAVLFVVIRTVALPRGAIGIYNTLMDGRQLLLLTAFTLVAAIGAAILPSVFRGDIFSFPMRVGLLGMQEPIAPSTANFTQTAYLCVSLLVAATYCWLAQRPQFINDFTKFAIFGAVAVVLTGTMDVAADFTGLGSTLSVFRTASYAFIPAAEIQGVKRTIGLMPEASSFGALAAAQFALLLFTRDVYLPKLRFWIIYPLTASCAGFAVLSTSSTAYVAIAVTMLLLALDTARGLLFGVPSERETKAKELTVFIALFVVMALMALVLESTREVLFKVIDESIFQKTQSSSFIERSSWTRAAYEAWLSSGGLGVGAGSVRTSNLFVNILASTGFLGSFFFALFLIKVLISSCPRGTNPRKSDLAHGAKLAMLPTLVGAALAGTTPDYGGTVAALMGIVIGVTFAARRPIGMRPMRPSARAVTART